MNKLITALASACLLAGCAATPTTPTEERIMDTSVTLLPGESAALSRSATLRYDSVSDSRCPAGVVCIWAGTIDYNLTLSSKAGAESFRLSRLQPVFEATTLKGVRIALNQTVEPPVPAPGEPAPAYPVTLTITQSRPSNVK